MGAHAPLKTPLPAPMERTSSSAAAAASPAERLSALVASGRVTAFLFLRHSETAKRDASLPPLEADLARVLTAEGVEKCRRAGEELFGGAGGPDGAPGWLGARGVPSAVKLCLISPTLRTRDTARHVLGDGAGSASVREIQSFYNTDAHTQGTAINRATGKLSYASLQGYLDEGEDTREEYLRFGERGLADMVAAIEAEVGQDSSEEGCCLGCVLCVGHAVDSSSIALATLRALSGNADVASPTPHMSTVLNIVQDTVSGILVDTACGVRAEYFRCSDAAAVAPP